VNDQLHAARVVEEALGDDARLRGHAAQRVDARDDVVAQQLGAAAVERARRISAARVLAARRGAAISSRSAATSADSSRVRAGPSPSQNGIVGGAPAASSTRTRPARRGGCATTSCRAG
jgi:hypothetical protein